MRASLPFFIAAFVVLPLQAETGLDRPQPITANLNGMFPQNAPNAATPGSGAWTQRNYFPDVGFIEPLRIIENPAANELVILGKDALGYSITHEEGATDKRQFFDLRPIVHGNPDFGEGGISDMAFHPEFGQPGSLNSNFVYFSYWWSPDNSGTFSNDNGVDGYNRLSRFEVVNSAVDLATELVMINQYDREYWHIGMDLEFGEDGYLYISAGDETPTTCCDRADSSQRLDGGLWSGILRIDVDNNPSRSHAIRRQPTHPSANPKVNGAHWPLSFSQGYSIPNDNPFLYPDGSGLEEFYSLGLRHPWTMKIDNETGDIWVGDVGRFTREEINRIAKGDNNEWPYREGSFTGPDSPPLEIIGKESPPVWDYSHDDGVSVIMGGVYRGNRHPELVGKTLFSDFVEGHLWAAIPASDTYEVEKIGNISGGYTNGISSYLFDSKGQILMVRNAGPLNTRGRIDILTRENSGAVTEPAPNFLSKTGAFTDLLSRTAVDGCISYEEIVPFWSDGAVKSRWLCLPNDGTHDTPAEQITFSEEEPWKFPVGSVFIKHFDMEAVNGDPTTRFPIETRFLVVGPDGHYGLSYQWNDSGTDAALVQAEGSNRVINQISLDGTEDSRLWEFPSRAQCLECHNNTTSSTLGVNTRQLNSLHTYQSSGLSGNQIETLAHLGMFSETLELDTLLPTVLTASATDDLSASIEDRARSYLDANCGYCHRNGIVRANFDARLSTTLDEQNLIDGQLIESVGIDGERVIVAGDPSRSIIHYRANLLGTGAMPPLAKNQIDEAGVALLDEWIRSLGPETNNPALPSAENESPSDDGESDPATSGNAGSGGGSLMWVVWILLGATVMRNGRQPRENIGT